ncbi:protein mono-ADP-ribosyltransferase PARP14-like [Mytilus galloprovincialis]|uniref:protein mono-ADP-ribosyltransferase PARP14-like n=1 Tax=Mytilus galloprovincialis TaxID=29158 RepID=UPI003F7BB624
MDKSNELTPSATVTKYTVEVRGMKETTSSNTIRYYFESRRGANCDVIDIRYVPNKRMYLLTFDGNEDVSVIFKKEHKVEGAVLHVEEHVAPTYCKNKAMITGLNAKSSKDNVTNFIEARTKQDVASVEFGDEESGTAIITFLKPVDIGQLQAVCKKRTLDGNHIEVHNVAESDCIIVKGFSPKTTSGTIEYYFDNKRRSGVEGVVKTEMNTDQGYCVVYFQDPKNAMAACENSHIIDKCKLTVQIFYDCLGIHHDEDKAAFEVPQPVYITNIDNKKLKFLLHSTLSQSQLCEQLQAINAEITWPSSSDDNKVEMKCTLSKEKSGYQKLAQTWSRDVKEGVDKYLQSLQVDKHSVAENLHTLLMSRLKELNMENPDNVSVIIEKTTSFEIYIVGHKTPVQTLSAIIKEMIKDITKDITRKSKEMSDMISFKHHQLILLEYTHFADKLKSKYVGIDIQIDTKGNVVKFCGTRVDITAAKVEIFEILNGIVSECFGKRSKLFIQYLKRPDVEKKIYGKFQASGTVGVLDLQDGTIYVHAMTNNEADTCAEILKESIIEISLDIENWQTPVLNSREFGRYIEDLEDEYRNTILEITTNQLDEVAIYCLSQSDGHLVHKKLSDFISMNGVQEKSYQLSPDDVKLLQELMKEEIEKLEKELKQENIVFNITHNSIFIKGQGKAFEDAVKEVESLLKCINSVASNSKFQKVVKKVMGKTKLKQIGEDGNESSDDDLDDGTRTDSKGIVQGNASEIACFTTNGNKEVLIIKGDITQLDVDVIVNAANKDLQHKGGLARVLVKIGGKSIQDECEQYITKSGPLSDGEVFCSKSGDLNCKMIAHAVGPTWKGGKHNEEKYLVQCIETCLAVTEKNKFASIAIPALCTGIFHYPSEAATNVIVEIVKDYFRVHPSSCIQTVCLCDVVFDTVKLFQKAANMHFAKTASKGLTAASDQQNVQIGNIEIKIIKGQLAKMKVGAIVNTTSKELKLDHGAVSASLLKNGGPSLQQECSQNYPNGINYGAIAVTSGGNLKCKIVCHGCLNQWRKEGSEIKELEKFVMECLSTASKNKCSSIAFPAMGTGKLRYPAGLVAKSLHKCVEEFSLQNPKSVITEVLFVVYDKDHDTVKAFETEENHRKKTSTVKNTDRILKGGISSVVFSRMNDEEKREVLKTAIAAKQHFEEELKETKDEMKKKDEELDQLQKKVSNRQLLMHGEKEALEGNKVVYFDLYPERAYKEGSAAQTHFRLAESQFYRLISGSGNSFTVNKVQYVVNPPLVKHFHKAIDDMKKHRGAKMAYPILAFHGTQATNIKSIVENNFKVPGQQGFAHRTDTGFYGRGVYFSEYPGYSMGYISGATQLLLCQVLPGNVYVCPAVIQGASLQQGHDSHMSPDKKELVIFNSHHILPFYIVHYTTRGFAYQQKKF